jgi:hypothetical protein
VARNQRPRPTAEDRKNTQVGCGILLAALLVVGGCSALINGDDDSSSGSSSSSSVHDGSSGSGGGTASVTVGDFVGMELQTAQDAAQGDGIHALDSTDATGQGRMQLLDRNWTVCAQTPAAGETMSTDDTLTFDTVKSSEGETCGDLAASGGSDGGGDYGEDDSTAAAGAGNDGSDDNSSSVAGTGDDDSVNSTGGGSSSSTGGSDAAESDSNASSSSSSSSGGSPQAPVGATALCGDGTYSYSAHRRGTCSHHGGVAGWLAGAPS